MFRAIGLILISAGLWLAAGPAVAGRGNSESPTDPVLLEKLAETLAANHEETDRFDAQVWLMASEQRLERYLDSHDVRLALLQLVYREV